MIEAPAALRSVCWSFVAGLAVATGCSSDEQAPGSTGPGAGGAGASAGNGGSTSTGGSGVAGTAGAGFGGSTSAGGTGAGTSAGGSTGGTTSPGGSTSSGGNGTGGTSAGACGRQVGACTAPTATVTEVDLGVQITGYGTEWDTQPLPMAIAALPSGGSRLAVRGTDGQIHIAELDCDDNLVGAPFSLPGEDLQDLYADADGGVVMLTRPALGSGEHQCGADTLCAGESAPCYNSYLVRFDNAGNEVWATMVTNADADQDAYVDGARFVWGHYQHHGRIAFDGSNYAAYFCIGITVQNNACVDIHEGDRMQVVDGTGSLVANHPDAFPVGCSHSWTTRIVWDPRTNHFVMVCATDNPNPENCRIAQPNPYRTVATAACNGELFGGDIVLSSTPGYWTAWSYSGQIRLEHFTDGESDTTITNAGASQHPHLVSYGTNRMLLAWESGDGMAAQVRDSGTGEAVGAEFTIDVPDHAYQAFKAFPDGSAAYPAAGSNGTSVRIARVMPCSG